MNQKSMTNMAEKCKQPWIQLIVLLIVIGIILTTVGIFGCRMRMASADLPVNAPGDDTTAADDTIADFPFSREPYSMAAPMRAEYATDVVTIPKDAIKSDYAALACVESNQVIASRHSQEQIYPASLTKIMTMIIVVENLQTLESLQDKITVSQSVYEQMTAAGSSGAGLAPGEVISVEGMLYLLMLESDGIAAVELAIYTAGSEEAFVNMMNAKAKVMGLTGTHFANCTGLHDDRHYSTCLDLASIMCYALGNTFCYTLLTTKEYNVSAYSAEKDKDFTYYASHTLLVDRAKLVLKSQPTNLTVTGGKTGYTDESKHCLATCAIAPDGTHYVTVTAKTDSALNTVTDYITIYENYVTK